MRRVHVDAWSTILGIAILAGAIALILAVLNPVR